MLKVYLIEKENNKELVSVIREKRVIVDNFKTANVIVIDKVTNVREALDKIDFALMQGTEILCIKNIFSKEGYVANYLIKDGANYV